MTYKLTKILHPHLEYPFHANTKITTRLYSSRTPLNSNIIDLVSSVDFLKMKTSTLILAAILFLENLTAGDLNEDIQKSSALQPIAHSRKRRYVVFPEGSTLTVATSLQIAACVSPTALSGTGAIFTNGLAWALSYDLPNETIHTKDNKYEFPVMIRRHKRDLFIRMEKLMDSAGIDGRSCLLKTICETAQHLVPREGILEEILRLIFTYPPEKEPGEPLKKAYVKAHLAGESEENCNDLFPCPISLLELGLGFGKYPNSYV